MKKTEKIVTAHQIPGVHNMAQRRLNARWCQYGTRVIECQVMPIWYKGHKMPGGANITQRTFNVRWCQNGTSLGKKLVLCD